MLAIFQTAADGFLGEHIVHGEVLTNVTKKIEIADAGGPVVVIHHDGGVVAVEGDESLELAADAFAIRCDQVRCHELALGRTATGVPDHAGRTADQYDRAMAGALEAGEHQRWNQAANVEAIGRRVETDIDRLLGSGEQLIEGGPVGYLINRSAEF